MLAQVLLLIAAIGIFLYFFSRKHNTQMQAGKRIAFLMFLALNVYAVLFPEHTTWLAHRIGIASGAHLLLYILVVAFIFAMLNTYLRFRGVTQQLTELARTVAIQEAELNNYRRGLATDHELPGPVAAAHPTDQGQQGE